MVTILLATYNGEMFLEEQIDSILNQTFQDWRLVIRDDFSSDRSLEIINDYIVQDSRISLIDYGGLHGSACGNFSQLTEWAIANTSGYVMYSDQDDIWHPEKIATSLQELKKLEAINGKDLPLMCYSDFQYVDRHGNALSQEVRLPKALEIRILLNENYAWGCTIILNHAALSAVAPIPMNAVNHDYWIALVVAGLGKATLINRKLVSYRQHTANVSGSVDDRKFSKRFSRYVTNRTYMMRPLCANLVTIRQFYLRYSGKLTDCQNCLIKSFLDAYLTGFVSMVVTMINYRIFKLGLGKNIVYFYTLLLLRKKVVREANKICNF